MKTITVDVWLYGSLARYSGKVARKSYANLQPELPTESRLCDLLVGLELLTEEWGSIFINGDRVAFFRLKSM